MKEKKFYLPAENFKVAEAVHLGYSFYFMTYKTKRAALKMFASLNAAGWVDSFEPVKDRKKVYKFNITEEMEKRVKAFVLPTIPKNWFTVRQPWQAL